MAQWASLTIQDFIDQDKVVLDVVLSDLSKVGLHHAQHLMQELKHHGGVHILLGDCRQPDVGPLDVKKAGPSDVGDWRPNLLPGMDDVHPKRVHRNPSAVTD